MRTPLINGVLVACVILLVGFMSYNFIGHQLTQLAGVSSQRTSSQTPIQPSDTPIPSISVTPSISPLPFISISPSY